MKRNLWSSRRIRATFFNDFDTLLFLFHPSYSNVYYLLPERSKWYKLCTSPIQVIFFSFFCQIIRFFPSNIRVTALAQPKQKTKMKKNHDRREKNSNHDLFESWTSSPSISPTHLHYYPCITCCSLSLSFSSSWLDAGNCMSARTWTFYVEIMPA